MRRHSPHGENAYDGISLDPLEVMFIKVRSYTVDADLSSARKALKYADWLQVGGWMGGQAAHVPAGPAVGQKAKTESGLKHGWGRTQLIKQAWLGCLAGRIHCCWHLFARLCPDVEAWLPPKRP